MSSSSTHGEDTSVTSGAFPGDSLIVTCLIQVLEYAADLMGHVDMLAEHWPERPGALERFVDKVAAEGALLFLLSERAATSRPLEAARLRLADGVRRLARGERNAALMLRFPHCAPELGLAHLALQCGGDRDDDFDSMLRKAWATDQIESLERVPFRQLEMLWQARIGGLPCSYDPAGIMSTSVLDHLPNPCNASREQCYQLTHAVMYTTDFGRDAPQLSGREQVLAEHIDGLLAWHLGELDYDLLGELLIAKACLETQWSARDAVAWRLLQRTFQGHGHLVDRDFDGQAHHALRGTPAIAYLERHRYHTTFVFGILCVLLLVRSGPPTTPWSGNPRVLPARRLEVGALCLDARDSVMIVAMGGQPQAQVQVDDPVVAPREADVRPCLPPEDALGPAHPLGTRAQPEADSLWLDLPRDEIRADVAVLRAVRQYDLPRVMNVISQVVGARAPCTPVVLASIEFMARQVLPTGEAGGMFLAPANRATPAAPAFARAFVLFMQSCAEYLDPTNSDPL